jgi:hypothetical protein
MKDEHDLDFLKVLSKFLKLVCDQEDNSSNKFGKLKWMIIQLDTGINCQIAESNVTFVPESAN